MSVLYTFFNSSSKCAGCQDKLTFFGKRVKCVECSKIHSDLVYCSNCSIEVEENNSWLFGSKYYCIECHSTQVTALFNNFSSFDTVNHKTTRQPVTPPKFDEPIDPEDDDLDTPLTPNANFAADAMKILMQVQRTPSKQQVPLM